MNNKWPKILRKRRLGREDWNREKLGRLGERSKILDLFNCWNENLTTKSDEDENMSASMTELININTVFINARLSILIWTYYL